MSIRSIARVLVALVPVLGISVAQARAAPLCGDVTSGWCVARRIISTERRGELGFRFGEPLDVDGDGKADIAAGARFKERELHQDGMAAVWSGETGEQIRAWDGVLQDGLFGHSVLPLADLDGDGLADLVISAPNAKRDGAGHGMIVARSPATNKVLWQRYGKRGENFGWDLASAGDQDGDGVADFFVGAPAHDEGRAYLVSGHDGNPIREFSPQSDTPTFGWYVARLDDLDGDGSADLVAGSYLASGPAGPFAGAAHVFSSATGKILHHWQGPEDRSGFGEVVEGIGDLDGDGRGDVVVAAPRTNDHSHKLPGDVYVYSGATGEETRHWQGKQSGELYGRMIAAAGDVDGDSVEDLAIGSPWYRTPLGRRVGRFELRSGRTGAIIANFLGSVADGWFGWHITRAPDPDGLGRAALLISTLRHPAGLETGTGILELYVLSERAATEQTNPPPALSRDRVEQR